MLTDKRLRYLWCLVTGGALLMPIPFFASRMDQLIGAGDLNRWVHFLVYAMVAAIPVAAWGRRTILLLSLVLALVGIALELLPAFIPGTIVRPQNAQAELFGVGAGILLGLNLRMMRNSAKPLNRVSPNPSVTFSATFPIGSKRR